MLSTLHPLPKLVICCLWVMASIFIFDATFQLLAIGGTHGESYAAPPFSEIGVALPG